MKPKVPYGTLNPISKPRFKEGIDTNQASNFEMIKSILRNFYDNKIKVAGEYSGYVLAVLPEELNTEISFIDRVWDSIGNFFDTKPMYKQVIVRVPEIHSWIPEPKNETDYVSIGLHDRFLALDKSFTNLSYGTLVKVTFYDADGKYEPTIKEVILEGSSPLPQDETSPKTAMESAAPSPQIALSGDPIGAGVKGNNVVPSSDYLDYSVPAPPQVIRPSIAGKTQITISPAEVYKENRVRITETGISNLPGNSPLLVPVRSNKGKQKVHVLVKPRFDALVEAAARDGIDVYCQSGWRKPWKSRQEYDLFIEKNYVNNPDSKFYYENFIKSGTTAERAKEIARRKGQGVKAWLSPHFSGLAVDFYIPPPKGSGQYYVAPSIPGNSSYGKFSDKQKESDGFKWLHANAHKFGFTPFAAEAWHWELMVPIDSWQTGQEFTDNWAVRVSEQSNRTKQYTTDRDFAV